MDLALVFNKLSTMEIEPSLKESVDKLSKKTGHDYSFIRLIKASLEFPCPSRCISEAEGKFHSKKIDPFYSQRHNFIKRLLIDNIQARLYSLGLISIISSESQTIHGRGDIDIDSTGSNIDLASKNLKIRVELKGGDSFSLEQIFRYLFDFDVVIVCLAGSGRVFKINKDASTEFLRFFQESISKKIEFMMNNSTLTTLGPWCVGCELACPHSKKEHYWSANFQKELVSPLNNWPRAIKQTVNEVISTILTYQSQDSSPSESLLFTK